MHNTRVVFLSLFLLCAFIFVASNTAYADSNTTAAQREALETQLAQVEEQIQQNQAQLAKEQAAANTYQNQVNTLDSQIKEAQLEIKQRNLTIQELNDGIAQDNQGISQVDTNVAASQASLAQILRDTQQMDDTSFAEIALGGSLDNLFADMGDFDHIKEAMASSFTQMAQQRSTLSSSEQALQNKQQEQSQLLQLQQLQQQSLQSTETQKQKLVTESKTQIAAYQSAISDQQQTVTQIEQALFSLANTNTSVSFGDMYNYSKAASAVTGVPPAFILGILSEESDLGQNVGNCSYQTAMNPNNVPTFLSLMQQLGLDPNAQKVSCKPSYGWGGAMGPAQFIPNTWQLYQDRIASASGQNPPNPWDPRTAAFATAIYMSDLGADAGTSASERTAALKYFAGGSWQNPAFAFYGNDVMALTQKYQNQIDQINGS
ncbi:MAG TPA: hypothetical protein VMU27_01740 [Candidatus Paceibacterota bacterium]|nr:hypothetical protein [Candidatus Paceibacterota bacterium]